MDTTNVGINARQILLFDAQQKNLVFRSVTYECTKYDSDIAQTNYFPSINWKADTIKRRTG